MERAEFISGKKNTEHKLIVIAGATASGKTDLSIKLALQFQTEIISADARQFYREMNIGTAKPEVEQLKMVKHHFINSLSIQDDYSAGKFREDVLNLLKKLFEKVNTVIMVGGSGLFIRAVLNGFDEIPETSIEAKKKINELYNTQGLVGLQELLKQLDSEYFKEVDIQNPYRLQRALEICISSGKPFSSFRKGARVENDFNVDYFVVNLEREELYKRINDRVDGMMKSGLLEEAKSLYSFSKLNALNTVGYKELFEYLDNRISLDKAIDLVKQHTRNYAKRQLTWYRKEANAQWKTKEEIHKIFS